MVNFFLHTCIGLEAQQHALYALEADGEEQSARRQGHTKTTKEKEVTGDKKVTMRRKRKTQCYIVTVKCQT
jgi:hypothetical protein